MIRPCVTLLPRTNGLAEGTATARTGRFQFRDRIGRPGVPVIRVHRRRAQVLAHRQPDPHAADLNDHRAITGAEVPHSSNTSIRKQSLVVPLDDPREARLAQRDRVRQQRFRPSRQGVPISTVRPSGTPDAIRST